MTNPSPPSAAPAQAPAWPESIPGGCLTPAERTPPVSANGSSQAETDAPANINKDDNKEDPRVVMEEGGGEKEEANKVSAPQQEAVQLADEARDIDQELDEKAAADREAEQVLLQRILAQPGCGLQLIAEHTASVRRQAAMKSFALLTKGFKGRQAGLQRRAVVAEERCARLAARLGITAEEEEEEEEAAEGQRAEEGGGGSTRVPEGLAVLQKRLVDWCTAMVRLGGHFRVFSCPFEAQCSARIGTFRGTFR